MKSTGVEDLKAALRRSLWLFIVLPIVGAAAMTAFRQSQDPQYEATGRVVLPQSELAATLAGVSPVYVDPERADEAEENLAVAKGLYDRASRATGGRYGPGRSCVGDGSRRRQQPREIRGDHERRARRGRDRERSLQ